MTENSDTPVVIVERRSSGLGAFLGGTILGAVVALLYAPKSGEETQAEIRDRVKRLRDEAEDRLHLMRDDVEGRYRRVRDDVEDRVGDGRCLRDLHVEVLDERPLRADLHVSAAGRAAPGLEEVHDDDYTFELGKADVLKDGSDAVIFLSRSAIESVNCSFSITQGPAINSKGCPSPHR